ncbi:hypothetical protein F2Q69_00050761 [Brassica cretica]|uniref:Uncharacterized protein n=1 Tax=Brassica cretica TaxID=69181 RepID=A0A8S9PNI1_BRACR|nr:hypothetical protein F2Q69_00050761 [Brassica cretica]
MNINNGLSAIVQVVLADNETTSVSTSRLLINPSQDTKKENIENKSEVELLKICVEEAQYKTYIIEIFKHTNRLTHLYLSIRLRINRFPSSSRATTREIPPSTFVEDSHRETTTPPPRDYDAATERLRRFVEDREHKSPSSRENPQERKKRRK